MYNDLHTLPLMGHSTRAKQWNGEKSNTNRFWAKLITISRKKWDSTIDNNKIIHKKKQEQDR